jgi:hypothetical protein
MERELTNYGKLFNNRHLEGINFQVLSETLNNQ